MSVAEIWSKASPKLKTGSSIRHRPWEKYMSMNDLYLFIPWVLLISADILPPWEKGIVL
jgi:hypothetical protein